MQMQSSLEKEFCVGTKGLENNFCFNEKKKRNLYFRVFVCGCVCDAFAGNFDLSRPTSYPGMGMYHTEYKIPTAFGEGQRSSKVT